jgi:hypothetical protein
MTKVVQHAPLSGFCRQPNCQSGIEKVILVHELAHSRAATEQEIVLNWNLTYFYVCCLSFIDLGCAYLTKKISSLNVNILRKKLFSVSRTFKID